MCSTCGSWGQANWPMLQALAGAKDLCSLVSQGLSGVWKWGRHTWGEAWVEGMRDAGNTRNKTEKGVKNLINSRCASHQLKCCIKSIMAQIYNED